eukprot:5952055-Alexandrium_andersonii.AAC.1
MIPQSCRDFRSLFKGSGELRMGSGEVRRFVCWPLPSRACPGSAECITEAPPGAAGMQHGSS